MAYQQADTISQAARSCFEQRCEPLDIVCSDDASTDATYDLLRREAAAYTGPHRIVMRRNDVNLGIAAHYNRLLEEATGELFVTAAGDDISEPDRVARLLQAWNATGGRADLVSSHVIDMSRDGASCGVLRVDDLAAFGGVDDWIRRRPYVIGAGHAFTRRMMLRFGPLDPALAYEDQIMAFRAIASGGGLTVDAPLVRYRRGGASGRQRFGCPAELTSWRRMRLRREVAEREQLTRDARVAGCEGAIVEALEGLRLRQLYIQRLGAAGTARERWRTLRQAEALPPVWRVRKWLQAQFPGLRI